MKKNLQMKSYIIGSICLFAGLGFLTVVPLIAKVFYFLSDPNFYRWTGGLFILLSGGFYIFSHELYKKQIINIGLIFIIFGIFQLSIIHVVYKTYFFSIFLSFSTGILLLFTGFFKLK